ncbi:MAG: ornithine carbamoyltransferase [Candidatus Fimadaptatus sp.]
MKLESYFPQKTFAQKHLLTLQDWTTDEIYQTLSLALSLKFKQRNGIPHELLKGKTLGMIFTKSSTRTRVSFEVGIQQLGGRALFLSDRDIQLGRGEPISDTARVLSRFIDGIMIRTFAQSDVEGLAEHGSIPVINGLTDRFHPCQVLADLMTIYEHKGTLEGLKLAFIGDGANNMGHSLMLGCSKLGINVAICSPRGYHPDPEVTEWARANAARFGSEVLITEDYMEAARGADAVYTDVWSSMGMEAEIEKRKQVFAGCCVNDELMSVAQPDAIFLHCLPAHRGEEVTASVIDGPHSVVFDEAENRLHAQKAVMALLMK